MHQKLLFIGLLFISLNCCSQNAPLINGFAHNDYWHKRPLYDALDNGYVNIEADIYLRSGELVVAHLLPVFKRRRTLENIYFKPLLACINRLDTSVVCPNLPLTLMIDIKSDAEKTYRVLNQLLQKYSTMLSGLENGEYIPRRVTVILTGNKPIHMLKSQPTRLAFIDEDLTKVYQDTLASNVYQTASCKYSALVKWQGQGEFPEAQKEKLRKYVEMAHKFGKRVRLWASPENPAVWDELLQCGVDLINTDRLAQFKQFSLERGMLAAHVK